jgi:hypothetical protein
MPITWNIEGATLSLVLEGASELTEIKTVFRSAFSDARLRPGVALLIDERRSTANPTADEKRARVAWIASLRPNIGARVALVTAADPLRYGIARMASVFFETEGMVAEVFTEADDAKRWLVGRGTSA